ncbi:unnamed protein product [Macrosiphum euphorbiae]|uniref:Uncharacterized protein n=1 Tax=Macrosiphum euphorbiae TaxID=13131 RepID=A0AAV0XEF2_9HEMI|nr:unnamed protein product [Macrosiphum euphorbiae]
MNNVPDKDKTPKLGKLINFTVVHFRELVHCDCVTLQDYLKIDEVIAVYESSTEESIVEEVRKKENPDEFEEEDDEEEHAIEQSKLTEEDILNTFYERRTIFKNNKQTKLTDYFF